MERGRGNDSGGASGMLVVLDTLVRGVGTLAMSGSAFGIGPMEE